MNFDIEVSEVVFVRNSADARYSSIHKGQPGHGREHKGNEGGGHTVLP